MCTEIVPGMNNHSYRKQYPYSEIPDYLAALLVEFLSLLLSNYTDLSDVEGQLSQVQIK